MSEDAARSPVQRFVVGVAKRALPRPARRWLRRALGAAPRPTRSPETHSVCFELPRPPGSAQPPNYATIRAPANAFLPRRLAEVGLAGLEPEAMACFLAALEEAGPGAVLDVGANVGIYGLLARSLGRPTVHGFEPVPEIAEIARRCAAENGLDYPVLAQALGRAPAVATLYLSQVTDTSNSLNARFRPSARQIQVPVMTVDDHVRRHQLSPVVIKVDTETTEPDVLAGAAAVVAEHRPWFFVEVLPRRVEAALTEVVRSWGYTWYHCSGSLPFPEQPSFDHALEDEAAVMWMLAPAPCTPAFWERAAGWSRSIAACTPVAQALSPA